MYYVQKLKHTEDAAQESARRKWEFIKDALDDANEYMFAIGVFFASIDGVRMDHPNAKTLHETGETDFIETNDQTLLDSVPKRLRAYARLKMLGEAKPADILYKLHELEDEIRMCVIFNDELPSKEKLDLWHHRIREAREEFLNELSKIY